jgi:4-aminobutyrate aminotransferase/(S)-3-amino-2-methylpropionate transaminase
VPYGDARTAERAITSDTGAILVEPIQGRGGLRIPPSGFLAELRAIADRAGILLICDEVYTGLGRTGAWLASEHEGVVPDIVALGKALGCGFPISACVGRPEVMRAWGEAQGEAVHTSTHLGNPLGCALAHLVLQILERDALAERARTLGEHALLHLRAELAGAPGVVEVRGRGLMLGIERETREAANRAVRGALESGWILLGEGDDGRVLSLTPPLTIAEDVLDGGLNRLVELLSR